VIATKVPPFPLIARFTYGLIEYPQTSYVVAGKAKNLKGMYISVDKEHYSLMSSGDTLLIGGEGHIPGLGIPSKKYKKLTAYGKKHFGLESQDYQWKAMDYIAYDKLPVIGRLYPWSRNTYVLTGFKKWGLSTSMLAAEADKDLIDGKKSPVTKLFYPQRISAPLSIPKAIKEYLKS
jgi:glycine/D-amino acid oxidase-like deaminating enzyme